jgi:hypothetical protein
MPAFVRIGQHPTPTSKVIARGWSAQRSGRTVVVRWGPIEVVQVKLGVTKFVWVIKRKLPRLKVYRCASKSTARAKYADLKALKTTKACRFSRGWDPVFSE